MIYLSWRIIIVNLLDEYFIVVYTNIHITITCCQKQSKECLAPLPMCGLTNTRRLSAREWLETKALSKLNKHLIMAPKWLEESLLKKQEQLILDCLFSKIANKLKNKLDAMLLSFMFLLQELPMLSSKPYQLNLILLLLSLMVFLSMIWSKSNMFYAHKIKLGSLDQTVLELLNLTNVKLVSCLGIFTKQVKLESSADLEPSLMKQSTKLPRLDLDNQLLLESEEILLMVPTLLMSYKSLLLILKLKE